MRDTIAQSQNAFSGVFIDECQVAELLCQSVRTIQKWRVTGNGPGFYKLGRSVRYQLDEVVAWAEARRKAHTSHNDHDPVIPSKHTCCAGSKGPSVSRSNARALTDEPRRTGHSFSRERIRRKKYKTREEVRQDVFDYIEFFYNPQRKHVRNGMLSLIDFEQLQKLKLQGVSQTRRYSLWGSTITGRVKGNLRRNSR